MIFLINTSSQGDCVQRSRRESGNEPSSFYHSATSGHCQGAESGGPPAHVTNTDDDVIYMTYMFPRVFGDEFGDDIGDSLNLVIYLVTHSVMNFVNH